MAGHLPACVDHCGNLHGRARKGGGNAVDSDRQVFQQTVQPPEPCAGTVFIDRFHIGMPLPRPLRGTHDLGQKRFRRGITVQDVVFPAFFVVQHQLYGDLRAAGPFGSRGRGAVTLHVAGIAIHLSLLLSFSV